MTVLDDIIVGVREDLTQRQASVPIAELHERVASRSAPLPVISSLSAGGIQLIAEVKRSSPSKGAFAAIPAPADLARSYARGGAMAISVLTEQRRFGGNLDDLSAVREAVDIPILRKDFMVDEYQFWEARAFGADIVLLIVAALEQEQILAFLDLSRSLGMTPIVEVHDQEETSRALDAGAKVLGVNARNLKTLEVDRSLFARIAPQIPESCICIAESAVRSASDVAHLAKVGADAVLVGEALVTGANPESLVREMIKAGRQAE